MKLECFICNSPSVHKLKDHGNIVYVNCSSELCGDYEISIRASSSLKEHLYSKENFQSLVRSYNQQDKVADIYFDGNDLKIGVVGQR